MKDSVAFKLITSGLYEVRETIAIIKDPENINLAKLKQLAQNEETFEIDLQSEVNDYFCPVLKMILKSAI